MEPRNYLANASATPPVAPATPSVGHPRAAVPGVSPATTPGPYWFYQIEQELRNVIVKFGLTPDDNDLTQMYSAIAGNMPYRNIVTFLSTSSWTVLTDTTRCYVRVVGGGGGAGRGPIGGGGGGGGGIAEELVTGLTPGANVTVTVGIGGAGRTASQGVGVPGGTSSFWPHCSATGGGAGDTWAAGATGVGAGGDYNYGYGPGESAARIDATANPQYRGGSGGGAGARTTGSGTRGTQGESATVPGAGGAGGNENGDGGSGAGGTVIILY